MTGGRHPPADATTVKLTQPLPAFRIDDAVLEWLWHVLEAKCAEAGPPPGSLSVSEEVRMAGRRAPEERAQVSERRRAAADARWARPASGLTAARLDTVGRRRPACQLLGVRRVSGVGRHRGARRGLVPRGGGRRPRGAPAAHGLVPPLHRASYGTIAAVTAATLAALFGSLGSRLASVVEPRCAGDPLRTRRHVVAGTVLPLR